MMQQVHCIVFFVIVSRFLAVKVKGLLIGQSVDDETSNKIRKIIESRPEVEKIFNLITIQLGPQVMVAVKAKMKATDNINQLISNINACEEALTQEISTIQWVFFEPDLKD